MKLSFLFVFIITSLFNFPAYSNIIVFVDMNKLISTSKPGSFLMKQLDDLSKNNIINFKKKEKNFKKEETQLLDQKKILSPENFEKKINNLKLQVNLYNKEKLKTIKYFDEIKLKNTNNLLELINQILIKYSTENSISLILQKRNLIMGKNELDITNKIIKLINREIKEKIIE
tara:strand:+ start:110 stop:628 length:519 start_codon:yes stop_codon:yes gene_type:complete